MKIFIDENNKIIDVGTTDDTSLREITVDDKMFAGWSIAKICCYAVYLDGDVVTGFYPFVPTSLIGHIDQLGKQIESVTPFYASVIAKQGDKSVFFDEVPEGEVVVSIITNDGDSVPCQIDKDRNRVIVLFDTLENDAIVTISVN